jgi:hypothetical protein
MKDMTESYLVAQTAVAQLKGAIHHVLAHAPGEGMKNVDIGRLLGIYMGHVEHEGHIPRTLLSMMESEGVVEQDLKSKTWRLRA